MKNLTGKDPETEEVVKGHFKNRMLVLGVSLTKRADIDDFFRSIGNENLEKIKTELDDRVDEGGVFNMRFDKQAAFLGEVTLKSGGDVITVRAKPKVYHGGMDATLKVVQDHIEKMMAK